MSVTLGTNAPCEFLRLRSDSAVLGWFAAQPRAACW
jgi:hypothetical protein